MYSDTLAHRSPTRMDARRGTRMAGPRSRMGAARRPSSHRALASPPGRVETFFAARHVAGRLSLSRAANSRGNRLNGPCAVAVSFFLDARCGGQRGPGSGGEGNGRARASCRRTRRRQRARGGAKGRGRARSRRGPFFLGAVRRLMPCVAAPADGGGERGSRPRRAGEKHQAPTMSSKKQVRSCPGNARGACA